MLVWLGAGEMMAGGRVAWILVGLLAVGAGVRAATQPPAETLPEQAEPAWKFSLSAYTYFVPEDSDYAQPTITADRRGLHLEARYNYEDLDTSSVWVGYNFSVGETVSLEITPMLGGIFGNTTGIAPGYHFSLDWRWLELNSEGEYLFDTDDHADSFFYTWSELTVSPVDWLRAGLVGQHTQVYESPWEIQPGILVGFRFKRAEIAAHVFDSDDSAPLYVLFVGVEFGAR